MLGTVIAGDNSPISIIFYQNKKCAVKKLVVIEGTALAEKAALETRILRELKDLHPQLISIIDIVETKKRETVDVHSPYGGYALVSEERLQIEYDIIMPYYQRGSLDRYLKQIVKYSVFEGVAIEIFRQILVGVAILHDHHYVHGSIKPDNILLDDQGNVKITDFGDCAIIDEYSIVTALDDIKFGRRPQPEGCVHLYNYFGGIEAPEINEEALGLKSLFEQLFPHRSKPHLADFYNYMSQLFYNKNLNYIELLLKTPLLNDPKLRKHPNTLFLVNSPIEDKLKEIYSRQTLYLKLLEVTHTFSQVTKKDERDITERFSELWLEDFSVLTTKPLLANPPTGFQKLHIEFALNTISPQDIDKKIAQFWAYTKKYPITFDLRQCARVSKEAYQLAKHDSDPTQAASTCLNELYRKGWEIRKVYGDETPRAPRAYIAIQPVNSRRRKIIIVFVGAATLPNPLETWWTHDTDKQLDIWGKVNFFKNDKEHIGLKSYARDIIEKIMQEFGDHQQTLSQFDFELTGHSTGGVLAMETALFLKRVYSPSSVRAITFATPNFMTPEECKQFSIEFPNDEHHSFYNLFALNDMAHSIYGNRFHQPQGNTIYLIPNQYSGKSFIEIYAASRGTSEQCIKNHFPPHYQTLVENLYKEFSTEQQPRVRL